MKPKNSQAASSQSTEVIERLLKQLPSQFLDWNSDPIGYTRERFEMAIKHGIGQEERMVIQSILEVFRFDCKFDEVVEVYMEVARVWLAKNRIQ